MLAAYITSVLNLDSVTKNPITITFQWIFYIIHFTCHGYFSLCTMILVSFAVTLKHFGRQLVMDLGALKEGANFNEVSGQTLLTLSYSIFNEWCFKNVIWKLHESWIPLKGLELISKARHVKGIVDDILGRSILFVYIVSLSEYGQTPSVQLQETPFQNKIPFFTYLIFNGTFWVLASHFHNKVKILLCLFN